MTRRFLGLLAVATLLCGVALNGLSPTWGFAAVQPTLVPIPASSVPPVLCGASSDGRYLLYFLPGVAAGADEIHRFDQQTDTDVVVGAGKNGLPRISADGHHIVYADYTVVYAWDEDQNGQATTIQLSPSDNNVLAMWPSMSSDGRYVTWGGTDTVVLDRQSGGLLSLGYSGMGVLSPDGSKVALYGQGQIREFDSNTGALIRTMDRQGTSGYDIQELSSDGSYAIATAGIALVWLDLVNGQQRTVITNEDGGYIGGTGSGGHLASISADGQTVAFTAVTDGVSFSSTGTLRGYFVYDAPTGLITSISGFWGGPDLNNNSSTVMLQDASALLYTATPPSANSPANRSVAISGATGVSAGAVDRTVVYSSAIFRRPTPAPLTVTPARRGQGARSATLHLAGSGFTKKSQVSIVGGGGFTIQKVLYFSPSRIDVVVGVDSSAMLGARTIQVVNNNGTADICHSCLAVTAAPRITSSNQSLLRRGFVDKSLVLTGSGLTARTVFNLGPGTKVLSTKVLNSTSVSLVVTVSSSALRGARVVTVSNPDGGRSQTPGILSVK